MSFEEPTRFERLGLRVEWTFSAPLIVWYLRRLGLHGDETLLEVGCGGGAVTRRLSRRLPRGRVIGVDPSAYWVEYARRKLRREKNVSLHVGDILNADVEPESFDAALLHYVLHDIATADRPSTLNRICELLKEGGLLYVREPTKTSHGIAASEIRSLTESVGLREERGEERRSILLGPSFEGVFRRI
jgi:ubiquinone/menaquinone biosynthesis C-methylase UbiE